MTLGLGYLTSVDRYITTNGILSSSAHKNAKKRSINKYLSSENGFLIKGAEYIGLENATGG